MQILPLESIPTYNSTYKIPKSMTGLSIIESNYNSTLSCYPTDTVQQK